MLKFLSIFFISLNCFCLSIDDFYQKICLKIFSEEVQTIFCITCNIEKLNFSVLGINIYQKNFNEVEILNKLNRVNHG